MTLRVRVITIEGDSADVATAITAVTAAFGGQPVAALPAPTVTSVRALPAPRAKGTPGTPGKFDAAVLKALAFSPATVGEIATAVCPKGTKPTAFMPRLYSVLYRMVKQGVIRKSGKTYAVK